MITDERVESAAPARANPANGFGLAVGNVMRVVGIPAREVRARH
jgi:hypothetical protein